MKALALVPLALAGALATAEVAAGGPQAPAPAAVAVGGTTPTSPPTPPVVDAVGRARRDLAVMALDSDHVQGGLGEARRTGDPKRAACLHEMLSQTHATERDMLHTLGAAELALRAGGPDAAEPFRERLRTLVERSRALLLEARLCGKEVSRRAPAPTEYRVRAKSPPLPGDPGDKTWRMVRHESQWVPPPARDPLSP
ncbi:MAG: hypothetical protein HY908_31615 [Myxococcales bacterium]|nr:hypothetical protein [Myxococcales bacterium]